ncbi:MAG: FecR domain-containing protein [Proteobacteria bacterium]|nr:FecR domain-containing protein [Pseudomonadota bacterium]
MNSRNFFSRLLTAYCLLLTFAAVGLRPVWVYDPEGGLLPGRRSLGAVGSAVVIIALCSLLFALCPVAALAATFDQVRGDVTIIPASPEGQEVGRPARTDGSAGPEARPGSRPGMAAVGAAVNPGETIRVGLDSEARLALPDGTQLKIFARTQLVYNEDLSDPEARGYLLGLVWGRILSQVVPRKDGGAPYKVVTPSAVCGVRGTEFIVAVADDGETRVGVEKGEVEVSGADGTERLPAGMETSVAVGRRPLRPVSALLAKIDWEGWISERNARLKEKLSAQVAALTETARLMDARLDQLNRRVQKIEVDTREFARQRRAAIENGDRDLSRSLEARLKSSLDEGVEVNRFIAEARSRRDVALASGEQALRGLAGKGEELQGRLRKLADDLEAFRASLAKKSKADQEVYRKRLESFRDLFQDSGRQ